MRPDALALVTSLLTTAAARFRIDGTTSTGTLAPHDPGHTAAPLALFDTASDVHLPARYRTLEEAHLGVLHALFGSANQSVPAKSAPAVAWAKPADLATLERGVLGGARHGMYVASEPDEDCSVPVYFGAPGAPAGATPEQPAIDRGGDALPQRVVVAWAHPRELDARGFAALRALYGDAGDPLDQRIPSGGVPVYAAAEGESLEALQAETNTWLDATAFRFVVEHNWISTEVRCRRGIQDGHIESARAAIASARVAYAAKA